MGVLQSLTTASAALLCVQLVQAAPPTAAGQ
jgi:hypothetical protein